ncbi:MAG: flagellar basal body protein FliL [Treponema sp.]|jgi:flagellar basal body-associated protein FliL|nr:flagellar basal body protein FliL [Treponema sp.]
MKRVEERPPRTMVILHRALVITAITLAAIILVGTVYGLLRKGNSPADTEAPSKENGEAAGGEDIFFGLGTMRIPTADPEPETLIISITFPYDKNDRPFSEELASRIPYFRSVTEEYLGALSAGELDALEEESVNAELLNRYNAGLRLGQIKELYISEYMRL